MTHRSPVWTAPALLALAMSVPSASAQMIAPNPYAPVQGGWGQLPEGRQWGATSAVYPSPDGMTMWVAERCGANVCDDPNGVDPVLQFDPDGNYLTEWGGTGTANGEFRDPHALAMDAQGRLFVGDRANSRIQIFTQDGEHLETWHQFGRPSGLFIDENDVLYSADSESNTGRNRGWRRGIYIGSARTGFVTAFIPDPEPDPDNSGTSAAEGVAVDAFGNVYGAEVGPRRMRKYILRDSGFHHGAPSTDGEPVRRRSR